MNFAIKLVLILLGVTVLILSVPVLMYFPGYNFATVQKGAFYRSRQMSGPALERYINKYGIKTVINLRGNNPDSDWYKAETAVCQKLGVTHESFGWSRGRMPEPESLKKYVELIETGQGPFLAHCEGGTHRAGFASAAYELIQGKGAAAARKQFGPMFKDAPIGRVVDLYEGNDMPFGQWVREVYPILYESEKTSKVAPDKLRVLRLQPAA